ncbi:unnamed protein product [Adineta ricciae]|nr:unnamed protein product [Adineta ricciae]
MKSIVDVLETLVNNDQVSPSQRALFNMTYKFVTNIKSLWEEGNTENYSVSIRDNPNEMMGQMKFLNNMLLSFVPSHPHLQDWPLTITCYQDIISLKYLPPNSLELLQAYMSIGLTFNHQSWKLFKNRHNRQYNSLDEEQRRRNIWEENVQMIQKHNLEADLGVHTFTMKVNQFADLTHEEFIKQMTGLRINSETKPSQKVHISSNRKLPTTVDWRKNGYVTPVKDQKQCGSCWAFSTTGTLEGQVAKKTQKLIALSEQQLVDCTTDYGNMGCNGGLMDNSYKYLLDHHGIESNASYPYTGVFGECRYNPKDVVANVTSYVDIKAGSEADLEDALATVGPIAVAMDASHSSFQFYTSGVYSDPECSPTLIDFSLLAVGYGVTSDNHEYYILKNQWTTEWGMEGYVLMARNKNNQCGIASLASYALI